MGKLLQEKKYEPESQPEGEPGQEYGGKRSL